MLDKIDKDKVRVHDTKPAFEAAGDNVKSMMTLEATVDPTPQELRKLRPYEGACLRIPGHLPMEAQEVLKHLFDCFDRRGEIKEGLIGDLIWGFSQSGINPTLTINGIIHLSKSGYVKFKSKDNQYVGFDSDKIESAWVEYQPKLLEMVYAK